MIHYVFDLRDAYPGAFWRIVESARATAKSHPDSCVHWLTHQGQEDEFRRCAGPLGAREVWTLADRQQPYRAWDNALSQAVQSGDAHCIVATFSREVWDWARQRESMGWRVTAQAMTLYLQRSPLQGPAQQPRSAGAVAPTRSWTEIVSVEVAAQTVYRELQNRLRTRTRRYPVYRTDIVPILQEAFPRLEGPDCSRVGLTAEVTEYGKVRGWFRILPSRSEANPQICLLDEMTGYGCSTDELPSIGSAPSPRVSDSAAEARARLEQPGYPPPDVPSAMGLPAESHRPAMPTDPVHDSGGDGSITRAQETHSPVPPTEPERGECKPLGGRAKHKKRALDGHLRDRLNEQRVGLPADTRNGLSEWLQSEVKESPLPYALTVQELTRAVEEELAPSYEDACNGGSPRYALRRYKDHRERPLDRKFMSASVHARLFVRLLICSHCIEVGQKSSIQRIVPSHERRKTLMEEYLVYCLANHDQGLSSSECKAAAQVVLGSRHESEVVRELLSGLEERGLLEMRDGAGGAPRFYALAAYCPCEHLGSASVNDDGATP